MSSNDNETYCESCEADRLWETEGIQPVWASPTHTCGGPLYDLASKTWDKSCPCVEAMQTDPDCEWHGRITRHREHVDQAVVDLFKVGVTGYIEREYRWIVVSESDFEILEAMATYPNPGPTPLDATFFGIPIHTAPDWTCDPAAVALARTLAILSGPFKRTLRVLIKAVDHG